MLIKYNEAKKVSSENSFANITLIWRNDDLMKKCLIAIALMISSIQADEKQEEHEGPWLFLFDGETLAGWTDGEGKAVEEGSWVAQEGVLTLQSGGTGSLFSAKEYGDFEFSFEWRISKNGNSGVKYRLAKFGGKWLGLEYQVLDDEGHPDGKNGPIRQAAALYDLKPPSDGKKLKAVGEWNQSRIVVREGVVTHYLNGKEVVTLQIPSEEWTERFEKSKYQKTKGFGVNEKGLLQLQDHKDVVSYRNLKIREF